ncbi:MAG: GNAT family N-acetyltransferase [Chitinophaga sp.]|uniref:GNAT family N-acetyltransferase n=1 Tax=Chitinophaga sp. TaxID=1869181 RepID=UPI0025BB2C04|nr:GNAT family N-acetyltransferase [Chitinophaga sp.]MBV8251321.1 GNAT family N-acetyltransferase [Chitinophaga sp.]
MIHLIPKEVSNNEELQQIAALSLANNAADLTADEKAKEGFLTWSYQLPVLQELHKVVPSIIVKDGDKVAGYALVLTHDAAPIYEPLQDMIRVLNPILYAGKPLSEHNFYIMGQICVHPDYRGKGVFQLLYDYHRERYAAHYDFLLTEIAVTNFRSQRAHERTGFRTIHTHTDKFGDWDIVVWDRGHGFTTRKP